MESEAGPETEQPPPSVSLWRRPPGRVFHVVLAFPAAAWLWSWSWPGGQILLWFPAVLAIGLGALAWGVRLLTFVRGRASSQPTGQARWFLVAPVSGVLVLALLIADVPLKARWALSRSEFENLLNEVMTDDSVQLTQDRRVGSYKVIVIDQRDGAVIFYDDVGTGIANDAGFAYLPNGPSPDLANSGFENPRFRHLGGYWYAFTASW